MEEAKETKSGEETGCCTTARKHCCGGKALVAIALLGIGAAGGYLCAKQCALKTPPAQSQSR